MGRNSTSTFSRPALLTFWSQAMALSPGMFAPVASIPVSLPAGFQVVKFLNVSELPVDKLFIS